MKNLMKKLFFIAMLAVTFLLVTAGFHVVKAEEIPTNLALQTSARLIAADGSVLNPAGWATGDAGYAVDGNTETFTAADACYLWIFEDDLGSVVNQINKVVVVFHTAAYATEYRVLISENGTVWNEAAHITDGAPGRREISLEPVNARYIRVQAISPDGVNTTLGGEMTITEFEVYAMSPVAVPLSITTTSSSEYDGMPDTSIYPAFMDNMPYQAWTMNGSTNYYQLEAAGGIGTYLWELETGALPDGLLLGADGKISGIPSKEGMFTFTAKVTDNSGNSCSKQLSMLVNAYRGKWMSDAKFGFMIQWGAFSYPPIMTKEQIPQFENRITEFDAEEWAQQMADRGAKVLNFTVVGGDGIRLWNSSTPSENELNLSFDLVGELIDACQSRGIKFIAYLPAGFQWIPNLTDYDPVDGTCATLHVGLISELLDKGIDGIWIDSCGSVNEPTWFDWSRVTALVRTKNPFATISSNPVGTRNGYVLQYPNTDVVIYEGGMGTSNSVLAKCLPNPTRKKLAIEVDNMLEPQWTWYDGAPAGMKSAGSIIESIKQNWSMGALYMLNFTPKTDGTFIDDSIEPTLDEICNWVKANSDQCQAPEASLDDSVEYSGQQTVALTSENADFIYYTLDGSKPTRESLAYENLIVVDSSVKIRAIAVKEGKGDSAIIEKSYIIIPQDNPVSIIKSVQPNVSVVAGTDDLDTFSGMKIIMGGEAVTVEKIGRYYVDGNNKKHRLRIVRENDKEVIASGIVDMAQGQPDEYGFVYGNIVPVTLQPYTAYYIMSSEDSSDLMRNGDLSGASTRYGVKIANAVWTDYSGTNYYYDLSLIKALPYMPYSSGHIQGQILNLKGTVGDIQPAKNIALGSYAYLEDNNGNPVGASGGTAVAQNAVDGNMGTYAAAGDDRWAWTLRIDLGSVKKGINKFIINAPQISTGLFATEYEILLSEDGVNWFTIVHGTGNNRLRYGASFAPVNARYIRVRSIKPDGPGQEGVQMWIAEFEVYCNNLALGTDASLQDNDGNPLPPSAGTAYASNAVDGDGSTFALAGESYAWTLMDDLGSVKTGINKVVVNFADTLYATDYEILLSTDGATWTTAASILGCTGGRKETAFAAADARYVGIRSIKPDGAGQTGKQMAITELEVYNDANLASNATAYLQDNNGNYLEPCAGVAFASNALDGDSSTIAQAGGSYAWTLHVDLGTEKKVGGVTVTFAPDLFATDYSILISSNGTDWVTKASVSNNLSGGRKSFTFSPEEARYLRIRANKPDGAGQTGTQMAIAELEVYEVKNTDAQILFGGEKYTSVYDTASVRISDPDSTATTIAAIVCSDSDNAGTQIILVRQADGKFTGSFGFSTSQSGEGKILVKDGDSVWINYVDSQDGLGEQRTFTSLKSTWSDLPAYTLTVNYSTNSTRRKGHGLEHNRDHASYQDLTATAQITNNMVSEQPVILVVALYDKKGEIVNYSLLSKVISSGDTEVVNAGFRIPKNMKGYTVKTFVWDGTDLGNTQQLPLSQVIQM